MKCVIFLFFSTYLVLISADRDLETEILQRCKYVRCNDVNDLNKESHIRDCIKTTCNSRHLKGANLQKFCIENCIEIVNEKHENPKPNEEGELPSVVDYAWLD